MNIILREVPRSDRILIRRLMEFYLYDFSEYVGSDVDENGIYGDEYLDLYWNDAARSAWLVTVIDRLAGFVLVNEYVLVEGNERSIAEFFVMRKYRRQGVGNQVAVQIFDRLPSKWEVRVVERNLPAQAFWRKVISAYTRGQFQESYLENEDWTGPVFSFDNRSQAG